MDRSVSRKRPWLAAALAMLVVGFGHLYLWRWRRALGWFVVSFAVTVAFVDPATAEALATGTGDGVDPLSILPMLGVAVGSTVDAYLLARDHNEAVRDRAAADDDGDGEPPARCAHCGRELDSDLEFCHWCTARIDAAAGNDER